MPSVKQESCEYQFWSHWFDPTLNQTQVCNSRARRTLLPLGHVSCFIYHSELRESRSVHFPVAQSVNLSARCFSSTQFLLIIKQECCEHQFRSHLYGPQLQLYVISFIVMMVIMQITTGSSFHRL